MKPTKVERGSRMNKRHDILASSGTFQHRGQSKAAG